MPTGPLESLLTTTPGAKTFSEPLDALLAEHFRQREMCGLLDRLASDPPAPDAAGLARAILIYLREQLPLHVLDEEHDLFQLLRNRTLAAEAIDEAFARLRREHTEDEHDTHLVIAGLERIAAAGQPEEAAAFIAAARAFTHAHRRHVAYENSSILPLARSRLTRTDLSRLSRRMAARRRAIG